MTLIEGIYYDGKSAKGHSVQIELQPDFLLFSISIADEITQSVQWKIIEIERQDFSSSDQLLLFYGNFPKQSIKIEGDESVRLFLAKYASIFNQNLVYNEVLGRNKWRIIGLGSLFVVGMVLFYYFLVMPLLAEKIISLVPKNKEIELGEKMINTLLNQIKVSGMKEDKNKSKLLMQFYRRAEFKNSYPIKIHFIKDSLVNAFAIMGGNVIIYEGIVNKMKNEEELAGLLAHELAHIEQRHSLKILAKNLTHYFIISLVTSDISGLAAVFIENASTLQNLSNSRSYEKEADISGYKTLKNLNINPSGMVHLFTHIKQEEEEQLTENQKKYLSFMATHPLTDERISYLDKKIKEEKINTKVYRKNKVLKALFNQIKE